MLNSIQCHAMAMLQYCEKGSCAWYNGSYEMQTLFLDYPVQTLKTLPPLLITLCMGPPWPSYKEVAGGTRTPSGCQGDHGWKGCCTSHQVAWSDGTGSSWRSHWWSGSWQPFLTVQNNRREYRMRLNFRGTKLSRFSWSGHHPRII